MKNITTIIVLVIASLFACQSQNIDLKQELDKITTYVDEQVNVDAGTSLIIVKNGKTIYTTSNGFSSVELKAENNINTQFDLASIGKMFTGYCIAELEEQGKISLDDDIRKYIKDFPEYKHKITVGHLVHHTSGIKNWTYLINKMGWSEEDKISTNQLLRAIYAQKRLDFIPGERYQYSNSGYVLLTKIIENITRKSFIDYTNENIFKPLQMDKTFFNDNQNRLIEGMAKAYRFRNGDMLRESYNTSALGSSSLISNAVDMAKWMNFLLSPPKDKELIIKKMFTTKKLNNGDNNNYAYGIEMDEFNGKKIIGHDGSWASFTSDMIIIPELKTGIFFANNYRVHTRSIMNLYLEVFIPGEKQTNEKKHKKNSKKRVKKEEKKVKLSKKELDKFTGIYKLRDAWYLEITRIGNDLYTRSTGEASYYMKPINNNTFTVSAYGNREITFKKNEQGEFNQLIYNKINAIKKATIPKVDQKKFKKYIGVYYSTELDLLFEFKVRDNKLVYSNIKNGTYELYYEKKNFLFSDGLLNKLFFEYKENKIDGFYLKNSKKKKLFYFQKANK